MTKKRSENTTYYCTRGKTRYFGQISGVLPNFTSCCFFGTPCDFSGTFLPFASSSFFLPFLRGKVYVTGLVVAQRGGLSR